MAVQTGHLDEHARAGEAEQRPCGPPLAGLGTILLIALVALIAVLVLLCVFVVAEEDLTAGAIGHLGQAAATTLSR